MNTLKPIEKMLAMAFVAALGFGLASCGGDDDDDNDGKDRDGNKQEQTDDNGGSKQDDDSQDDGGNASKTYISSVGSFKFAYNDDMTLASASNTSSIREDYFSIRFSYNPLRIDGTSRNEDYDSISYTVSDITLNSSGCITSLSIHETGSGGEEGSFDYHSSVSISYDSDGHPVRIREVGTSKDTNNDGETESYTETDTYTFTWRDGRLMSISYADSYGFTETFSYSYGDNPTPNKTGQWTSIIEDTDFAALTVSLFYAGLLGKAGSYHPTGVKFTANDSDVEEEDHSHSFSTVLNGDGTVASVLIDDSSRAAFSYTAK